MEGVDALPGLGKKEELLPYVTYLKTDAAEAEILTGTDDREKAAQILAGWGVREVMVTHHTEVIVLVDGTIYRAPFDPENLTGRRVGVIHVLPPIWQDGLRPVRMTPVKFAAALTSMKMESPVGSTDPRRTCWSECVVGIL